MKGISSLIVIAGLLITVLLMFSMPAQIFVQSPVDVISYQESISKTKENNCKIDGTRQEWTFGIRDMPPDARLSNADVRVSIISVDNPANAVRLGSAATISANTEKQNNILIVGFSGTPGEAALGGVQIDGTCRAEYTVRFTREAMSTTSTAGTTTTTIQQKETRFRIPLISDFIEWILGLFK